MVDVMLHGLANHLYPSLGHMGGFTAVQSYNYIAPAKSNMIAIQIDHVNQRQMNSRRL